MTIQRPHDVSGVLGCDGSATFSDFVDAAEAAGWSVDGYQPEAENATIGELLERRQPRPVLWSCGLLAARLSRVTARTKDGHVYTSKAAPRRASGPDLAYLFIGGEGHFGRIEHAELNLLRPPASYVFGRARFDDLAGLFAASRVVALNDPASTRAIDLAELTLECYSPVRDADPDLLAGFFTHHGFAVEEVRAVPREARFREPTADTPALMISGAFSALRRLIPQMTESKGRRKMTLRLDYPDIHGALVQIEVASTAGEFVEEMFVKITDLHGIDSVWVRQEPSQRGADFERAFGGQEAGR